MFCHAEWQDHAVETAGMKFEKIVPCLTASGSLALL